MIIIGLSGKAEHGKTTAANEFINVTSMSKLKDKKIGIVPLAKRMKEQAKMVGWDGEKDEKGRRLLQEISWPIKHYHGEDIYAKWCYEQAVEQGLDILLVDDVRMIAEVNYFSQLKKEGRIDDFILIRINRPKHVSKLTDEQLNDVSETQLDTYKFDYYVTNNSSKEHLGKEVCSLVEKIIN